ncbi:hypothetical protein [Streptomyces sp. NBC_00203]|uniref:hypothetical protein n=1 Tax=Streptomyces sp. NBC_00203 TaxID=2975680 RepID=UPI0032556296
MTPDWQVTVRRMVDMPPPVPAEIRTCGESASRSTETALPPDPTPMTGADSLALAIISRILGSFSRAFAGGLRVFFTITYVSRPATCQENVTPSSASLCVMRSAIRSLEKSRRPGTSTRISAASSEKFFGMWR